MIYDRRSTDEHDGTDDVPQPGLSPDGAVVEFEIARSKHDLEEAFEIVHDTYVRIGLMDPLPCGLRASIFNALPDTATFLAKLRDRAISTLTLVPDSPIGLPMDQIYKPEVDLLRADGRRLGEVSMLCDRRAIDQETFRDRILSVFVGLAKLMVQYAIHKASVSDLVITVHPHHEAFYARYLLFERIADERMYPSVKENPAVALRADLTRVVDPNRPLPKRYRPYVASKLPEETLAHPRLSSADVRCLFAERTDALSKADPEMRRYVLSLYGLTEDSAGLA